jgi:hypothetical protein
MEAVTILRELWRRRILVVAVALASIVLGLATAYTVSFPPESRSFQVGIATGRILVDTPDSQVVDVQPKGSGTLGIRAGVLANLMTEGDVKAAIAERAGLRPNQLRAGVEVDGELPTVLTNAAGDPGAHLLTTSPAVNPDGTPLPMIDIQTQAPTPGEAARLAESSVSGLNDYLNSKAAGEDVPDARRLQVTGFGAPEARTETLGGNRLLALLATIVLFLLGCAAILVGSRIASAWRVARTLEDEQEFEEAEEKPAVPAAAADAGSPVAVLRARWAHLRPRWRKAPTGGGETSKQPDKGSKRHPKKTPSGSRLLHATRGEDPSGNGDGRGAGRDQNGKQATRGRDAKQAKRADEAKSASRNGDVEPAETDAATVRS